MMTSATTNLSEMDNYAAQRSAMVVSQLRPNAVTDARLVAAMGEVQRELFVGRGHAVLAYRDRPLPLGHGREMNAPLATARLINEAAVNPSDTVLLVGAGGGYAAAVLARLAARVVALESDPALLTTARAALSGLGNVELAEGALGAGWPAAGPYDVIVIDGAIEQLPDALVEQVRVGGRIVGGIIERGVSRLASGVRSEGGFAMAPFADIDCVTLPGFAKPRTFQF
jgi:protein-L-isoaspartate(D-aspartate) O-methyltransferase